MRFFRSFLVVLVGLSFLQPRSLQAQVGVKGGNPPSVLEPEQGSMVAGTISAADEAQASDGEQDMAWEERREPYPGYLRPGAQLDQRVNALWLLGAGAFVLACAVVPLSILPPSANRNYGYVPFVGPWLAIAGIQGETASLPTENMVGLGVAGALQTLGVLLAIWAFLTPNESIVFDAPVGMPSPFQISLLPGAPGAEVGLSLVGRGVL